MGKVKTKLEFCFTFVLLLSLIPSVNGFGTVHFKSSIKTEPGRTLDFEVYFFNLGKPVKIRMNVTSLPETWVVRVKPEEFQLLTSPLEHIPTDKHARYVWLPDRKAYIKTFPVRVFIRVPSSAMRGNYTVVVSALSYPEKEGTMSVIQSRDFVFKIEVEGRERLVDIIRRGKTFVSEIPKRVTGFIAMNPDISFVWSFVGFIILMILIIDKKLRG